MSIVILNRVSKSKKNYAEWLKESKEKVYLLNHQETVETFEDTNLLRKGFNNFSTNGLVDYEVVEIHRNDPIKALIALEEGEIIRAGYLREYLNIEGQKLNSAVYFRDKYLMKTCLKKQGVRVPAFKKIDNRVDLFEFINQEGYPVLIKPLSSWSSKGIQVLNNEHDLKKCLLKNTFENYMVEKYLDAKVYHVDGLLINNKIVFCCASSYINTPLAYKKNIGFGSVLFEKGNKFADKLIEFVKSSLAKMPLTENMSFHVEVFHEEKSNELFICEMGSRTIGAGTDELIKYSFNLDLDKILTQAQAGVHLDMNIIERNISGQLFIRPQKGFLRHFPEKLPFDWCFIYEKRGILGEYYEGSSEKPTDSYAVVYFEGKTQKKLFERVEILEEYFIENTTWEN
ncbi:ATP-grasp domain-containing protein [Bacillus wiedmannii]|uniref:ATP-grasp domain-containing protein n=1 Tax=Bacillus wiedmannii TaxID=1890302 RepID=UPI000B4C1836|nr:ATP-grasp domain-containing protein [Bacillus wiedmannii]